MGAEMRPPKPKPLIMAVGITLLGGCIGGTLFGTILFGTILRFLKQEILIGIGSAVGFCIAASLFKVQDEY